MRARRLLLPLLLLLAVPATAEARSLGDRTLKRGAHGHDVRTLQRALTTLGFPTVPSDGVYGPKTARSVKRWEVSIKARYRDGRVSRGEGRRIVRDLKAKRRALQGGGGATNVPLAAGAVGPGAAPEAVTQAQSDLNVLKFAVPVDGAYGDATAAAIKAYQAAFFAAPSGVLTAEEVALLRARVASIPPGPHVFPVAGTWQFSGAGGRYGNDRGTHMHAGQDLPAPAGTPLVAVTNATVATRAYQASGAGNYLVLHGDDGFDYVYMHLRDPALVEEKDRVVAGQQVGVVGSTGRSTGPHLHFEIWTAHWYDGGAGFDPLPALLAWRQ